MTHKEEMDLLISELLDVITTVTRGHNGKHQPGSFLMEDQLMHIKRGIRHALTYLLEIEHGDKNDGDNHLFNASVRFMFAAVQENLKKKGGVAHEEEEKRECRSIRTAVY